MARTRGFDTEEVVSIITEQFWANGFEAVSIQDLAQATGLRPGSLHAAFGNKNDLFELAFKHYGQRFETHIQADVRGLNGAKEYLDRLIHAAITDPDRKGCLIINTSGELAAHSQSTKSAVQDRLETMRAFFRARLNEEGITSERAVNALFGAAVSILTLARARQPEEILKDIAAAAISSADDRRNC